jgi:serine/threonine protein kinase
MTPERLKLISRAFDEALKLAPPHRSVYLEETFANDSELRAEVEALLAAHAREHDAAPEADTSPKRSGRRARSKSDSLPEIIPGRTTLGSYNVLEKLGSGGMGTIYLAKDARLGRRVALKILPAHFARDEEFVRRFELEARAASSLNHPNIITVHEIGEAEGRRFIVTELVEGRTLREAMAEGPMPVREALEVCAQVAGALAKAHGAGIVHRDVKPENVMVDEEGHVKVLDFGIAKRLQHSAEINTEAPTSAQHVNTAAGVVLGTSTYMSPEQLRGQELDARTDIWSLGVVLYEALAARPPFEATNYGDLVVSILHGEPPPISEVRDDLPEELGEILSRALAKERDARFPSAKEFQSELKRLSRRLDVEAESTRGNVASTTPRFRDEERDAARLRAVATRQQEAAPQQTAPQQQTTEQRKQLTVLFADLSGLASLAEGDAEEDAGELLGELWPLLDAVVEEYGGSVDKHVGDTLVALWGSRVTQEDDPERAVRAALAMQRVVSDFAEERLPQGFDADTSNAPASDAQVPHASASAPLMRAGVSTGRALLGEVGATGELTVTGDAVRLASRLQQAAPPGSILLSHDTYTHVRGVFSVHPPESLETGVRGAEPVQFYRVERAKPRAFRVRTRGVEGVETRMVGRQAELSRLTDALDRLRRPKSFRPSPSSATPGSASRDCSTSCAEVELLPDFCTSSTGARPSQRAACLTRSCATCSPSASRYRTATRRRSRERSSSAAARELFGGARRALMRAHFIGHLIGLRLLRRARTSRAYSTTRSRYATAPSTTRRSSSPTSRASARRALPRRPALGRRRLARLHRPPHAQLRRLALDARLCLARPTCWSAARVGRGARAHARLSLQPLSKPREPPARRRDSARARGVPHALREMVVGGAEGNPFYVEELIKMLIDQRVIVPGRRRLARGREPPRRSQSAADADGRAAGATRRA